MPSNSVKHNSRIILIQKLFEKDFFSSNENDLFIGREQDLFPNSILKQISEVTKVDKDYINIIIESFPKNKEKIDAIISNLAPEWPIENIAKLDIAILRLSILEGFIIKITPEKVSINEAIDLAKEFSNDQSRKFISGVLGNLYSNQEKYLC